jgi:integrase
MSTLRKILNSAVEWGELETAPKFPRVKIPEQAFKFYDADEARRLIAAGAGLEDRALLTFALHSGCRAGEQLAVRWDDLDMKLKIVTFSRSSTRGIVRDSTKSGKLRTVPLTDALLDVLRELRAARALVQLDGDDLVFAGPDGEPLNVDRLHRVLRRAQKRAGLREGRWHDLRHSYASILTMAGTPIRNVQSWLGHATIGMTMRYSHLAPDHGREHLAAAFALPKPQATLRPRQPSRERQYQKT